MDKNDRDFDKEIEELEIQKLISRQPSYDDVMNDPTQKAFVPIFIIGNFLRKLQLQQI